MGPRHLLTHISSYTFVLLSLMHSEKQVRFKTNLLAKKHPTKIDFYWVRREKRFITFVACVSIFCNLVISIIFWLNMAAFLCALSSDICFENWQKNQDKSVCFNNSDHLTTQKIGVDNAVSQSEPKEKKNMRTRRFYPQFRERKKKGKQITLSAVWSLLVSSSPLALNWRQNVQRDRLETNFSDICGLLVTAVNVLLAHTQC